MIVAMDNREGAGWLGNHPRISGSQMSSNPSTITISFVIKQDTGDYLCIVETDGVEEATLRHSISVIGKLETKNLRRYFFVCILFN